MEPEEAHEPVHYGVARSNLLGRCTLGDGLWENRVVGKGIHMVLDSLHPSQRYLVLTLDGAR